MSGFSLATQLPALTVTIPSTNITDPYLRFIWDGNTAGGISPRGVISDSIDAQAHGAHFETYKAHGTRSAKTALSSGDTLGGLVLFGYDGTQGSGGAQYTQGAAFGARVSGNVSSGGTLPTTAYISINAVEVLAIDQNGRTTLTVPAIASTRERILEWTVSGTGSDKGGIGNGTGTDGVLQNTLWGLSETSTGTASLHFRGLLTAAGDASNSAPYGIVDVGLFRTDSTSNPNGGSFDVISNRKLFSIRNNTDLALIVQANLRTDFFKDIGMTEMTAPSAPAADGVRLYAQDNGAGKTQLMALFSSGAAQQLAIQP